MNTYEIISLVVAALSLLVSAYAAFSVQSLKTSIKVKGDKNITAGGDIKNAKF